MEKQWGFLRETEELARKAGRDGDTGLPRTGLLEYLGVIFPRVSQTDWVHDATTGLVDYRGVRSKRRPDYRNEELKLIIEVDGLPHYQSPAQIRVDEGNTEFYQQHGYKVVRIPYFIQLSQIVVKELFDVDVAVALFDDDVPSMGPLGRNTPTFLCPAGIRRMARDFTRFPAQYRANLRALKEISDEGLSEWRLLDAEFTRVAEAAVTSLSAVRHSPVVEQERPRVQ